MSSKKRLLLLITVAVAVILAVSALFAHSLSAKRTLVLSDEDTGQIYLELSIRDGDNFSVGYTHSVHLTPVIETYEVRDTDIYVVAAKFYTFGAGMQTDYPEGVTYTYDDDGAISLTGYNTLCKDLIYCVSKLYDHTLTCNGQEYSLGALCGKGTLVRFEIKH